MRRKLLIIVLLMCCIILIGIKVNADEIEKKHVDYTYILENDEVTIKRVIPDRAALLYIVSIPDQIDGHKVTKIADYAFENTAIRVAYIGKNVVSIGNRAFAECEDLESIVIPESVTDLGYGVFYKDKKMKSVVINGNLDIIGNSCFYQCSNLEDVEIKGSVKNIGQDAFYNCSSLEKINISSANKIGECAFKDCENLRTIEFSETITYIGGRAFENTRWIEKQKLQNSLVVIYDILIDGTSYTESELIIPENIKAISSYAFSNVISLKKVTIPENLDYIDSKGLFYGCTNLKEINLPNDLKEIKIGMFANCINIEKIDIPESVTVIEEKAFLNTKWLENKRKENPLVIINHILIDGTTCKGDVIIPEGVTNISDAAFFDAKEVTSINISNGVSKIGASAMSSCTNLKNIILPETVETISDCAFYHCPELTEIIIPSSVKKIGELAFGDCEKLSKVIFNGDIVEITGKIFDDSSRNENLVVYAKLEYKLLCQYLKQNKINYKVIGTEKTNFRVSSITAIKEEKVIIGIDIIGVSNFSTATFKLEYDKSKLEYININEGEILKQEGGKFYGIHNKKNATVLVQYNPDMENIAITEKKENLFNIEFKVIAEPGNDVSLILNCIELKGENGNMIPYEIEQGKVHIIENFKYKDVSKYDWFYSAVVHCYKNKIILGINDTTFAPNDKLTRAMLVTILHRMEGQPYQAGTSKFLDIKDTSAYYYVAVKWATANNIVSGYVNGKFGPNDPITREQLAVILNNYCRYKGKYKSIIADLSKFKDSNKISKFAKWGMNWAIATGIITGNETEKTLNPQGTATRAEVASMLYKYFINVK